MSIKYKCNLKGCPTNKIYQRHHVIFIISSYPLRKITDQYAVFQWFATQNLETKFRN